MPVRPLHLARPIFEPHVDDIVELVRIGYKKHLSHAGPLLKGSGEGDKMRDSPRLNRGRDAVLGRQDERCSVFPSWQS